MISNARNIPNDPCGAFCRDNHVALGHTGTGVLDGLTFAVKDVFHIAGHATGFGNPDWLETHPPEAVTASTISALLSAGADMVGRTLSDELTYSLSGENYHYGTPLNTFAPDRIPGGSSSGSAAAVAGGLVDFALGTDCGGSVRLPASYCGILGFRPTHGRVAVDGVIPFAPSFDVVGWFARDADSFERVGSVLFDEPPVAAIPRRLFLVQDAFDVLQPGVRDALEPSIDRLAGLIGDRQGRTITEKGLEAWFEVFRVVQGSEIWSNRKAWIEAVKPTIGPGIRERLEWASSIDTTAAAAARETFAGIRDRLRQLLEPGDLLCLPTSPRVAPRKGEPLDKLEVEYRAQAMCLLCIAGLGGLPQVSLPLAEHEGLPMGVSIVGPPGADMQLLALVKTLLDGKA